MSEDSEEDDYSDRSISDDDELDEDSFMKFVSDDIHQCTLLAADSIGDPFFPRTTQILLEYQLGRWVPRLREPRDLYGVSSSGPLSPTRWPYHCEVIDEKVQHIEWTPFVPEPVYIPTGLEIEPVYPNSKEDTVVYLAEDAYKEPCFVYSRVGGNRTSLKQPVDNCDNTLVFEARFESGNLQKVVKVLMEKREVILYCDLHGHSRKQNIFMYGCDGSSRSKTKGLYLQQRIFPLMLSKNCPNIFSFSACKFNVQKSKEGTGRVVMWKMGIRNSFTLEATFCGSTLGNKRGTHFSTKDLESIGYHFCDSLLDYCDPDRSKYYQCLKELEEMEKHMNFDRAFDDSDSLVEISLDVESSSRGSDSSESNDTQTYLLKVTSQERNKKKYLKTKGQRNAILANCQNSTQEVYGKELLLQRHEESNSDGKDLRPNVPDIYVAHCFRRSLPNQGLVKIPRQRFYPRKTQSSSRHMIKSLNKDHRTYILETCKNPIQEVQSRGIDIYESCFKVASLKCPMNKKPSNWTENIRIPTESHHQLKSKAKQCTSFQSKRTGTNWTDDEKRIYRDKRIARTQEILQYLLPIVESSQNIRSTQMNDLVNPRADLQHQLIPTACINRRRYSTPWTPTRNLPFKTQRNLMTHTSKWLQSVPQGSFESLSPLCNLQKRTKHFEFWTKKAKDVQLATSKWKTVPSSSNMDANIRVSRSTEHRHPHNLWCHHVPWTSACSSVSVQTTDIDNDPDMVLSSSTAHRHPVATDIF
ncbi:cytosolic carboxypeptidase 3 isoform X6 [Mastomys coucha]|uniref:cytosolic carboxypeptidase 3 isoform X6 n=2 Tax=Mastomys coucha TaxID=35658 RepID=UPI001261AE39|nr:cytosolic carboxypeptidase 3 isoform X6 [Mastomys coucha]